MNRAALAAAVLLSLLAAATRARAGTEEFSTFDVEAQELDDESLLDHLLTRAPAAWRDEWERSPQAIRTSQGCLTSGQWFIDTDLKLRAPLGGRAVFGLDMTERANDALSYDYIDFSFHFPTSWGTPGFMFRPTFDKSRQDVALLWDAGADTSRWQVQVAFGIEDMFNNLWAFRQTRVGNEAEPYQRHPYEPALRLATRQSGWRAEVGGRWLTPSRKRVSGLGPGSPASLVTLWGARGWAEVEADAFGATWGARAANHQARSTQWPLDDSTPDGRSFRRRWSAELTARRVLSPRLAVEARGLYQDRDQNAGAPLGPNGFGAVDRLMTLETTWTLSPSFHARVGGMFDRVSVAQSGTPRYASYGTRNESRAYVGLSARFGNVSVSAVEGVELDPEPYEVWGVHDKGFLHLQATF